MSVIIDDEGWLIGASRNPSPNQDARPLNVAVELLVIHAISLPPDTFGGPYIDALLTNSLDPNAHPYFAGIAALRVSAHFLIRRDGELCQYVSCDRRAWHAGVSSWRGRPACNDYSIGIELEGGDHHPFTDDQYLALYKVVDALSSRYPIQAILGHCHIAPGRKTDPGPHFDWQRLGNAISNRLQLP